MADTQKPGAVSSYMLLVDQERSTVLHMLGSLAGESGLEFLSALNENNLIGAFMSLVQELGEKEHELGWCPDTNCKYNEEVETED